MRNLGAKQKVPPHRQAQIKKRAANQQGDTLDDGAAPDDCPSWMKMFMMMMGGIIVGQGQQNARSSAPSCERSSSSSPVLTASTILMTKRAATSDTVVDYPALKEWLKAVQDSPIRNKHHEDFERLGVVLVDMHKLYTIEDIIFLSTQELATVASTDVGQASRILRFAKEDAASLENKKRKKHY